MRFNLVYMVQVDVNFYTSEGSDTYTIKYFDFGRCDACSFFTQNILRLIKLSARGVVCQYHDPEQAMYHNKAHQQTSTSYVYSTFL